MNLNAMDMQYAMDYIVYMMMCSFFGKAEAVSGSKEEKRRLLYLFLGYNRQVALEEEAETFFRKDILPDLPRDFLGGTVKVHWVTADNGRRTAVVFDSGDRQLWVTALFGGKVRTPVFRYCLIGQEEELPAAA